MKLKQKSIQITMRCDPETFCEIEKVAEGLSFGKENDFFMYLIKKGIEAINKNGDSASESESESESESDSASESESESESQSHRVTDSQSQDTDDWDSLKI
jgi:hypothetical protein